MVISPYVLEGRYSQDESQFVGAIVRNLPVRFLLRVVPNPPPLHFFFVIRYLQPISQAHHHPSTRTHKNNFSLLHTPLSGSSSTSTTSNIFLAVFINVKSARLLLLKQK